MYLTYAEYQALGGIMTDTAFTLSEYKARMFIDKLTHNRLHSFEIIPEAVKNCMIELINISQSEQGGKVISSESSGSYSVSFDVANISTAKHDLVKTYLGGITDSNGVYITYAGVE
jgi:hypothetical protein